MQYNETAPMPMSMRLSEFASGLHDALASALERGLAHALGLEGPHDPRDVAELLRQLHDGGKKLVEQHCLPLMGEVLLDGVAALKREPARNTVAGANSRYADDPRSFVAKLGGMREFEGGLDNFNGRPDGDNLEEQMQAEFANSTPFTTSNYGGVETNLLQEWEFVVKPVPNKIYPGEQGKPKGDGTFYPGRERKQLDVLMKLDLTVKAGLHRVEVIATRLYTGPAYMALNKGLREGGVEARKKGIANFPVTVAAFNSAIKKLRLVTKLPPQRKLFRGLSGMALPNEVLETGLFVEFAFSSATPNPEVAKEYAGSDRASLFEIDVSQVDRGACIALYSQYPAEEEHVLAPLALFEIVSARRQFGTNVYKLRLNVNLKSMTLEEVRESRRTMAREMALKLKQEFLQLTGRPSVEVDKIVQTNIEPVGCAWFNQARNCTDLLSKLESVFVRELEAEAEAQRRTAETQLPNATEECVNKLRLCVKIAKRCCANDAEGREEVLSAQKRLVAAVNANRPESCAATTSEGGDLMELAGFLQDKGDFEGALIHYQKSLDVFLAVYGQDHLDVAKTEENMAIIYQSQGKFEKTLEIYRKVLETKIRVCGQDHPDVATSKRNLADAYKSQGQKDRARQYYMECQQIYDKVFGSQHGYTRWAEAQVRECE